jgi:Mlc titration factor MtfA (ptsG expression regulator)
MWGWLRRLRVARATQITTIPDALWAQTLRDYPFLADWAGTRLPRLHTLSSQFLHRKEFHVAQGLTLTDAMAVAIAAQACLPLLHLGPDARALDWYDDFVGIVIHPGEVLARREVMDDAGVVHRYDEVIAGEAMDGGPVMLSWQDVAAASSEQGYNVVIHEFIHKIDLRDGRADGCPPLSAGFMGQPNAQAARTHWQTVLQAVFDDFCDRLGLAERFGAPAPWLDPYAAQSIDEFFAVAGEAYFVNPHRFDQELPTLRPLFDAFFQPQA